MIKLLKGLCRDRMLKFTQILMYFGLLKNSLQYNGEINNNYITLSTEPT